MSTTLHTRTRHYRLNISLVYDQALSTKMLIATLTDLTGSWRGPPVAAGLLRPRHPGPPGVHRVHRSLLHPAPRPGGLLTLPSRPNQRDPPAGVRHARPGADLTPSPSGGRLPSRTPAPPQTPPPASLVYTLYIYIAGNVEETIMRVGD